MFFVNAKRMKENLIFKHSNLCYEKNIPSVIDTIICRSCNIHFLQKRIYLQNI